VPCVVLDPCNGTGTVCDMAKKMGRAYVGIDAKPEYCDMAKERLKKQPKPLFAN